MIETLDNPKPQPEEHWHHEAVAWFRWAIENYIGDADFFCGVKMATEHAHEFFECRDFLAKNGSYYMEAGKRRTYPQKRDMSLAGRDWRAARRELCLDQGEPDEIRKPNIGGRYS